MPWWHERHMLNTLPRRSTPPCNSSLVPLPHHRCRQLLHPSIRLAMRPSWSAEPSGTTPQSMDSSSSMVRTSRSCSICHSRSSCSTSSRAASSNEGRRPTRRRAWAQVEPLPGTRATPQRGRLGSRAPVVPQRCRTASTPGRRPWTATAAAATATGAAPGPRTRCRPAPRAPTAGPSPPASSGARRRAGGRVANPQRWQLTHRTARPCWSPISRTI